MRILPKAAPGPAAARRVPCPARDGGFTLIEVMVTLACVVSLAAVAAPQVRGYLRDSHLVAARSYLAEVAEKQRLYKISTGKYCCTAYNTYDEQKLSTSLGVSLYDAGDFCIAFICASSTLCEAAQATPSFIVPADTGSPPTEFEVWAILRDPTAPGPVTGPGGMSCVPILTKVAATGWTFPATATGSAGRAGQVVALRYPPPPDGRSASAGTYHAVRFTWSGGISPSDAMSP